jgi:hypothetical protein
VLPFIQSCHFLSSSKENQKDKEIMKQAFAKDEEENNKESFMYEVLENVVSKKLTGVNFINGSNDQNKHKKLGMNKVSVCDMKGSKNIDEDVINGDLKMNSLEENGGYAQQLRPCQCNKQKMNDVTEDQYGKMVVSSQNKDSPDFKRRNDGKKRVEQIKNNNNNNNKGCENGELKISKSNKNSNNNDTGEIVNRKNDDDDDDRTEASGWKSSCSSSFEESYTSSKVC